MTHRSKVFAAAPVIIALLALLSQAFFSGAASYYRTSLQDMTQRAGAVAEVEVLARRFPEMPANEFQRTHVDVSILRTLKGSLPEKLTLDLPGGVRGNLVYDVPDSAEFMVGEKAMVFIKEPEAGHFMVQDLGLGKFNIVSRDNKQFVESAVCPQSLQGGQESTNLLTKSIPYDDFCKMIAAYATNEQPQMSPVKLALALRNSSSHRCDPNKPCQLAVEARNALSVAAADCQWFNAGICAVFVLLASALVVLLRRRQQQKAARISAKTLSLVIVLSLLVGAALGGSYSSAYVAMGPIWNLDDTSTPAKISGGTVVWKQSTQVSRSNANCMADVQGAFDKWASVANCRLAFTMAGQTSNTVHSGVDGVNFIAWDPNPNSDFSSATLAITYGVYSVGGTSYFIDSDMIFNDRDFTWGASGHSIKSVALHEAGHFIGLAHTTSTTAVMYPYDQGFTALSNDEIVAAQTLYPGTKSGTPPPPPPPPGPISTPPTAVIAASPVSGPPPLNCGFDGSASTAGSSPIATYAWNFGDGSSASTAIAGHLYPNAGTYTASLTVTDTKGLSNTATQTINVATSGQIMHASLKVALNVSNKDCLTLLLYSQNAAQFVSTNVTTGTFTLCNTPYAFTFNSSSNRGYGANGLQVTVSPKTGYVIVTMKNADLKTPLTAGGIDPTVAGSMTVPFSLVLGDGSQLAIYNTIILNVNTKAGRSTQGHY